MDVSFKDLLPKEKGSLGQKGLCAPFPEAGRALCKQRHGHPESTAGTPSLPALPRAAEPANPATGSQDAMGHRLLLVSLLLAGTARLRSDGFALSGMCPSISSLGTHTSRWPERC